MEVVFELGLLRLLANKFISARPHWDSLFPCVLDVLIVKRFATPAIELGPDWIVNRVAVSLPRAGTLAEEFPVGNREKKMVGTRGRQVMGSVPGRIAWSRLFAFLLEAVWKILHRSRS